jgi:hypothetical protein
MAVIISWIKNYSSLNDGEVLSGQDIGDLQTAINNHDHTFVTGTFVALSDVPNTYSGSALKYVRVNATATGLEFVASGGGGGSAASYSRTFVNADLSADMLGVNHALGSQLVVCQVYDNNLKMVLPDEIILNDANSLTLDLTSHVPISGTWSVKIVA